jgi:uncharacterized RDD family membrane protein YckC
MEWADELRIETPEQIEVELEVAGVGSRLVAQLLDWLIKWGILLGVSLVALVAAGLLGLTGAGKAVQVFLGAVVVALYYTFLLGFDIYFEVRHNGQTPGKKAAGIRVLREGGAALDFQTAAIRNLLGLADFLPFLYLLGALLILLNRRGQRLGDMAAGTVVIRERAAGPPVELMEEVQRLASEDFTFRPEHLVVCTADDRYVLKSYFQRRSELARKPRYQLACRLAEQLCKKTGYDLKERFVDGERAEVFLASLQRDLKSWEQNNR